MDAAAGVLILLFAGWVVSRHRPEPARGPGLLGWLWGERKQRQRVRREEAHYARLEKAEERRQTAAERRQEASERRAEAVERRREAKYQAQLKRQEKKEDAPLGGFFQ